jgi:hypothetical protein
VLVSFANQTLTMSHTKTCDGKIDQEDPEWWSWWVLDVTHKLRLWHDTVIRSCVYEELNPIHFIRFEDLLENPRDQLIELFKFILELDDLQGTNCLERID